jgi:hypothetical protein
MGQQELKGRGRDALGEKRIPGQGIRLLVSAESIDDPEQRADMLGLARMWMSLSQTGFGNIPDNHVG